MNPVIGKATPADIAVLKQATALFPKRSKLSDGLLPSLTHQRQNPNSDHNSGLAVDLTNDPANGVDCSVIFEKLKEDKRVKYLIHKGKIWSSDKAKSGNRAYSGSNPHHKHLHISIHPEFANDTSPWFWWLNQPSILNQVKAALQPVPAKKVVPSVQTQVCTCCPVHSPQRKAN